MTEKRLGRGIDALLGSACPHEILEFWRGAGKSRRHAKDGVRCVGCATEWTRERKYVGPKATRCVSLLVRRTAIRAETKNE